MSLPKPCKHPQPEPSLPHLKPLTVLALESFDTLSENYLLRDIDSTTFFLIYLRLPCSNPAFKHTTSSLNNLLEASSESTIRRHPRHRYCFRFNRNTTPSLASIISFLIRHHVQSLSSD